jgi:hypothetical protein
MPRPYDERNFDSLPSTIRPTARRLLEPVDEAEIAETTVVGGVTIVEVSRICLGVRMPNLASASLAASQERFATSLDCPDDTEYLLTFVRADYDGAMIRALQDKGWMCTGWSSPSQAGNREQRAIRERYKWRFLCPVERCREQRSLEKWTGAEQ